MATGKKKSSKKKKKKRSVRLENSRRTLFQLLEAAPADSDEREAMRLACWHALSERAQKAVALLVKNGDVHEGDLPDKRGPDELKKRKLTGPNIKRNGEDYRVASDLGREILDVTEIYLPDEEP